MPNARVIYNDFDNHLSRYSKVPTTLKVFEELANCFYELQATLDKATNPKLCLSKSLTPNQLSSFIDKFRQLIDQHDYETVDWGFIVNRFSDMGAVSVNAQAIAKDDLLRSLKNMSMVKLSAYELYKTKLITWQDYYDGLEITNLDYQELIDEYIPSLGYPTDRVLLILDPPYAGHKSYDYVDYVPREDQLMMLAYPYSTIFFNSDSLGLGGVLNLVRHLYPDDNRLGNVTVINSKLQNIDFGKGRTKDQQLKKELRNELLVIKSPNAEQIQQAFSS